jgi:hypothetical protein
MNSAESPVQHFVELIRPSTSSFAKAEAFIVREDDGEATGHSGGPTSTTVAKEESSGGEWVMGAGGTTTSGSGALCTM